MNMEDFQNTPESRFDRKMTKTPYKQKTRDGHHVLARLVGEFFLSRVYSLVLALSFLTFSVQNIALESKTAESDLSVESEVTYGTPARAGLPKRMVPKKNRNQGTTLYSSKLHVVQNSHHKLVASPGVRPGLPQRFKAVLGQNGLGRSLNT